MSFKYKVILHRIERAMLGSHFPPRRETVNIFT